ncbi:MAG: hypothetical protein ABMA64_17820, partial [Myxococcota bacterium]
APTGGRYVFSVRNEAFEVVLSVLDTCGGPELACKPQPAVDLAAGQTVVVVVDGFAAADAGTFTLAALPIASREDCSVGLDEDLDTLFDCADPDCSGSARCAEDCTAPLDEDQDGLFDCADSDCTAAPNCQPTCPDASLDTLPAGVVLDTSFHPDQVQISCGAVRAADSTVSFVAPTDGRYVVTVRGAGDVLTASDLIGGSVAVLDGCGGAELACAASPDGALDAELAVDLVAGQTAAVVVEGANTQAAGQVEVVVTPAGAVEAGCDDRVDDDGDGLRDCFDPDCSAVCGTCPEKALVGAPSTLMSTPTGDHHFADDCPPTAGIPDETVSFTAPTEGVYTFDTLGTIGHSTLTVRDGCFGDVLTCDDELYPPAEGFAFLAAGETVALVVDASGPYVLNVSAAIPFEVACDDGLDGDGDGSIDCADGDCGCETCPDVTLAERSFSWSGSTLGAPNEDSPWCAPSWAGEVEIAFTASETRTYTFDTFGSSFDTVLTLSLGCGAASYLCGDDAASTVQSELTYDMVAGETVLVNVDGYFGQEGDVVLNVR